MFLFSADSEATAQKEIQFFFPEFDIEKWKTDEEPLFQSGKVQFDEKSCEHMPVLQHGTSSQGGLWKTVFYCLLI